MSANANANASLAVKAPLARKPGWGSLPCLRCGERCIISLDLDDLLTCRCQGCEDEFTLAEVEAVIDAWRPILAWVALAQEPPASRAPF